MLFAGYRVDSETNLLLARHRFIHPTLGRWLQRDPLRYEDSSNLYEYVGSNSVGYIDPWGLEGSHIVTQPAPIAGKPDGWEELNREHMKDYAKGRASSATVLTVKDIADFNKQVSGICCKCVETLEITGHGNSWSHKQDYQRDADGKYKLDADGNKIPMDDGAIQNLGSEKAGSYSSKLGTSAIGVSKNSWLKRHTFWDKYEVHGVKEAFGGIDFCDPCTIILRGCNVGKRSAGKALMKAVAQQTKCSVEAFDDKPKTWLDGGLPGLPDAPHGPNVWQPAPPK